MQTDEIIRLMSEAGLRITDQRRTLAKLFADAPGYLSPKDVYDHMGHYYTGLSFDTVYRNLRVLDELGVLEQVMFEEGVKFKVHCREAHHHHHLICLSCGKTYPITLCPMEMTQVPEEFKVVKHKFEVFGYCKDCSAEAETAAAGSDS
ncbi:Fur family transcriptional regulator [Paenibacillus tarimensis]|uniref:Fur family transcriptional regulator n=1 Tax=Paenibacillus tarimensis TaxID=416012 RepID=UPI001F386427|nr:Fur family transcriptional regulator [Paenibacillus tarimensis]MCF2942406.1 transcriptional repressor [Paenibacillus tarimensis]